MAEPKFTPGPWEAIPDDENIEGGFPTEIHHGGQIIAFVCGADFPCFEGDRRALLIETTANANLIAAAPDLYEYLCKFVALGAQTPFCRNPEHRLRHPLCRGCQLDARKEEAIPILAKARGEK